MINLSSDFFAVSDEAENLNDNAALKQERKAFHQSFHKFSNHFFFFNHFLDRMKPAVVVNFTTSRKSPNYGGGWRYQVEGIENEGLAGGIFLPVYTPAILRNFSARRCRHSGKKGRE